jgi:hypothetical protein
MVDHAGLGCTCLGGARLGGARAFIDHVVEQIRSQRLAERFSAV